MSVAARPGGGSRTALFGMLGDERLARLAAAGHDRAFAVVYERHHQALYRYCRSILRNDADAQDALQSTFAAAFAALGRGRPDAPIRPWLFRIAHNEAVSALRRRRPTSDLSAAMDRCTTSVEDQVEERAELDTLLWDLRELNERQRSALVMRELSGLSHEEIAIALETSVGAAKQTIYEARRSLFEFAEGRAMACDEVQRTISDADGRLLRSRRVRAHLRECAACAAFATAIPARTRDLQAIAPPLPAVVAAGLLGRAAAAGYSHGTGSGLAGLATGAAGKTAGAAMAANALAGVAVVATATVGVTIGVDKLVHRAARPPTVPVVAPAENSIAAPAIAPGGASERASTSRAARTAGRATPSGQVRSLAPASSGIPSHGTAIQAGGKSTSVTVPGRGVQYNVGGPAGGSALGGHGLAPASTPTGSGPSQAAGAGSTQAGGGKPASTGQGRSASGAGKSASGAGKSASGAGNDASGRSQKGASAGSGKPPWAGSGKPRSTGPEIPVSAGSQKPASAGSRKPASAGSRNPASAGSQQPASAGSQQPASAGSGKPASAGSGKPTSPGGGTPGQTDSSGSAAGPPQGVPDGPAAGTRAAANLAGHGH